MAVLRRYSPQFFSVIGISIAGAAAHNIGQIVCAILIFQSAAVISYLPILLVIALVSGAATGYVCSLIFFKLNHLGMIKNSNPGKD